MTKIIFQQVLVARSCATKSAATSMKRTLLGFLICTGLTWAQPAPPRLLLPVPHTQSICVLQESPDGRYLASGDTTGVIKIWDQTTQQLHQTLVSQRSGFLPMWMSWLGPDKLVCYGSDFRFHSYDLNSGLQLKSQPEQPYRSRGGVAQAGGKVFFSPARPGTPTLEEWDPLSWTKLGSWDLPEKLSALSLNQGGDRACLVLEDGRALELSLPDGKAIWQLAQAPSNLSLHGYGPDGQTMLASNPQGLYLLSAGTVRGPFSHPPDHIVFWVVYRVQYLWDKKLVQWDPAQPENPGTVGSKTLPQYFSEGVAKHRLVLGGMEGGLLEAASAAPAMANPPFSQVRELAYDRKGRIYAGLLTGPVVCWSTQTGTRETLLGGQSRVWAWP